jgi:hypothetical protein
MGEMINAPKMLVGKDERKRRLGTHRRTWEDNIKNDLSEKDLEGVDWVHLTQDMDQWLALVSAVMNLDLP